MVCERAHGAPELRGSSRVASWGHPSRWSAPRAAWGRAPWLNRACTADECKAAPVVEFFLEKIKMNKIKSIFFIEKSKSEMHFFKEFKKENDCVISNEINKLLLEYNIKDCRF